MFIDEDNVADVMVNGRHGIIRLHGEIDLASRDRVRAAFLAARGTTQLRVDLADVTFIDVLGVAVILAAAHDLEHSGGTLTLENPRPGVTRILWLLGVDQLLAA